MLRNSSHQVFRLSAFSACMALASFCAAEEVRFDVPSVVIAQRIDASSVNQPLMGGKLVRIRVPVSIYFADQRGRISEATVTVSSPYRSLRVLDFSPRTQVASHIDGSVMVKRSESIKSNAGAKGGFNIQPAGNATIETGVQNATTVESTFQQKPEEHVVASSGTVDRGHGVFFRFRSGPGSIIEGVREIAILAEVSDAWRADMLTFSMKATVQGARRGQPSETRLWAVTYQEGDQAAAAQARRYIGAEQNLRGLAASHSDQVRQIANPNVFHKIGQALDIVEPRVAPDYLSSVIFSMRNRFYDNPQTNRLPVDLRIAILDYWDEREKLIAYARGGHTASSVANSAASLTRNSPVSLSAL